MRTTLNIDDEILDAAKVLAAERAVSVGAILSELARRGLQQGAVPRRKRKGFPTFAISHDSTPLTLERVKQFEDEH